MVNVVTPQIYKPLIKFNFLCIKYRVKKAGDVKNDPLNQTHVLRRPPHFDPPWTKLSIFGGAYACAFCNPTSPCARGVFLGTL